MKEDYVLFILPWYLVWSFHHWYCSLRDSYICYHSPYSNANPCLVDFIVLCSLDGHSSTILRYTKVLTILTWLRSLLSCPSGIRGYKSRGRFFCKNLAGDSTSNPCSLPCFIYFHPWCCGSSPFSVLAYVLCFQTSNSCLICRGVPDRVCLSWSMAHSYMHGRNSFCRFSAVYLDLKYI